MVQIAHLALLLACVVRSTNGQCPAGGGPGGSGKCSGEAQASGEDVTETDEQFNNASTTHNTCTAN